MLFVDSDAGRLARLATYFDTATLPIQVRAVTGATSVEAAPEAAPAPLEGPVGAASVGDSADEIEAIVEMLRAEGLEVVVEHGVLRGEVLGLEVARVVVWPAEVGGDDRLHLEVGVGRFDREAAAVVHPDRTRRSRSPVRPTPCGDTDAAGAPAHPLSLLARERWLRADRDREPLARRCRRAAPGRHDDRAGRH